MQVKYEDTPDPLYIKAEVFADKYKAYAIIANDYSNIVEVGINNDIVFSSYGKKAD